MNALTVQEGGDHYRDMKIQPVEYIEANNLDFFQGNIIKYISRHKRKNGAQDVRKARHFCDLILTLQYPESVVDLACKPEPRNIATKRSLAEARNDRGEKFVADVPAEIVAAAAKLEAYFTERNIKEWKLGGVQSRVD